MEPWAPPVLETTGIGGSETAVVYAARHLAARGWRVDVYNGAERFEGVYDGVGYFDPERVRPGEKADVLVVWRNPGGHALPIEAPVRLAWLHDLHYGPDAGTALRAYDRVLGVSRWHAEYLTRLYGLENADYVPNGIDLARFAGLEGERRVWGQCLYASSPDRGLDRLLTMWPHIRQDGVKLLVAYGFDNLEKRANGGDTNAAAYLERCRSMIASTEGVEYVGRLPQKELARLYATSWMWPYPTSFTETSCISAMEAMAGGCVPVCSSVAALKETVGGGGYLVPGLPESRAWAPTFMTIARAVLYELNTHKVGEIRSRARAPAHDWARAFDRWDTILSEVHGSRVAA